MLWVLLGPNYAQVHSNERIDELVLILEQNEFNKIFNMILDLCALLLQRQQEQATHLVAQLKP